MKSNFKIIAIATLGAFLGQCSSKTAEPEMAIDEAANTIIALTEAQQQLAGIAFGPVMQQAVNQKISCSGVVDVPPSNRVSLTSVYGGFVTYTGVYPGDKVQKGQLLAQMQDPLYIDMQRDYLENRSKLAFLQADFDRKSALIKTNSVSEKEFQQTKRDLEAAQIAQQALAAQLQMAGIGVDYLLEKGVQRTVGVRAPVSGFVVAVNINQGMHVAAGDALFELLDPTHVHVELSVFPDDAQNLAPGQTVNYRMAGNEQTFTGSIKLINKAVGSQNSIQVHVHPSEKDESSLLPGTFVQAEIVISQMEAYVLPRAAVNRVENGFLAYKKVDGGVLPVLFSPKFVSADVVEAQALVGAEYVQSGATKLLSLEEE